MNNNRAGRRNGRNNGRGRGVGRGGRDFSAVTHKKWGVIDDLPILRYRQADNLEDFTRALIQYCKREFGQLARRLKPLWGEFFPLGSVPF